MSSAFAAGMTDPVLGPLATLVSMAYRDGASDVHLESNGEMFHRINGKLERYDSPYDDSTMRMMLQKLWPDDGGILPIVDGTDGSVDRSATIGGVRVRANVSGTSTGLSVVFRLIPDTPPTPEELLLPPQVIDLIDAPHGLVLSTGEFGSGKLLSNLSAIPTPSGWTTMGDLAVGDQVFGRDGRPCRVLTLSEINETPDLYAVTLDDGQIIYADADHQWVVSSHADRVVPLRSKRRVAIDNYDRAHAIADRMDQFAISRGDSERITLSDLSELVFEQWPGLELRTKSGVAAALDAVDCPFVVNVERGIRTNVAPTMTTTLTYVLFDSAAALEANIDVWSRSRFGSVRARAEASTAVLDDIHFGARPAEASIVDIMGWLVESGITVNDRKSMTVNARAASAPERRELRREEVTLPTGEREWNGQVRVYDVTIALKHLALRLRQRYAQRPSTETGERVLMTREMLAEGLGVHVNNQNNFAITVPTAIDLPEADLPVAPYVLGAWLGDGSTGSGGFTGIDVEIIDEIKESGYAVSHRTEAKAHYIKGLRKGLRLAGVLCDKRIPIPYLRASTAQRLAVLQGLMDTDGTISTTGSCELALCKADLAADALELVRSLGIKASMTAGPAAITEADPDNPGATRRRVTSTRYRIKFTTTERVFRLPRKAERLPASVRETQRWLYITSIEPVPTEPGRCITVDSPDSTYLAEGFVPTHNTTLLASLIGRWNSLKPGHILCLEEPLEYLHPPKMARVSQREVGTHTPSFARGIRDARRSDPDIVMVGELRDPESVEAAMAASASGVLVLATLHAGTTVQALTALLAMVGDDRRDLVRTQLGQSLRGVVTQQLLPRLCQHCGGEGKVGRHMADQPGVGMVGSECQYCNGEGTKGRIAAREVLLGDGTVRGQIMDEGFKLIETTIESSRTEGMFLMNDDLLRLVMAGEISARTACEHSVKPEEMHKRIMTARERAAGNEGR